MMHPENIPSELLAQMVSLRRELHQYPERSLHEQRTARTISAALTRLDIPHRTAIAGTGIIADLPGPAGVPSIALRADTDALPIQEETGLSFASACPGVMHACGHDGHSSMLLGAAGLLSRLPALPAPVRLIWQPAEEIVAGAQPMIEAGALEGVGQIFGAHLDCRYPTGTLVITDGAVNAAADAFTIHIIGKGGHGARPHETVDAILTGSHLVTALQSVVSREIDPADPAVISVGRFEAGQAANAIARTALLQGTIRSLDPAVRSHLHQAIERIAQAVAMTHGAQIDLAIHHGPPAVRNAPIPTALARTAASRLGSARISQLDKANMGAEDFAYYLEHIPGCYVRIGACAPGQTAQPAHSSRFDFDEDALRFGASWFSQIALVAGRHLYEQHPAAARKTA